MPDGAEGGFIHAKDVNAALETLHSKGGYKELLFYVEACESGSIFKGLLKAPNVFAVTAANAKESSWGWYCPPQDKVQGKKIGSCLGDEFSVRWMEDADVANFKSETVNQQVAKVTKAVKKSHVSQFGDSSVIGSEVIGDFEGAQTSMMPIVLNSSRINFEDSSDSGVDSRDVEIHLAYYKLQRAETLEERRAAQEALAVLLQSRVAADEKFLAIAMAATKEDKAKAQAMMDGDVESLENVECHVQSLQAVAQSCGSLNDYTMRYSRLFANLCGTLKADDVRAAVVKVCHADKADIVV